MSNVRRMDYTDPRKLSPRDMLEGMLTSPRLQDVIDKARAGLLILETEGGDQFYYETFPAGCSPAGALWLLEKSKLAVLDSEMSKRGWESQAVTTGAPEELDATDELGTPRRKVFDRPFTFSPYCVSGFVGRDVCQCWRCYGDRMGFEDYSFAKVEIERKDLSPRLNDDLKT